LSRCSFLRMWGRWWATGSYTVGDLIPKKKLALKKCTAPYYGRRTPDLL
jgi:hypothetical protein